MTFLFLFLAIVVGVLSDRRKQWIIPMTILLLPSYQLRAAIFGVPTTLLELSLYGIAAACLLNTPGNLTERLKKFFSVRERPLRAVLIIFFVAATLAAALSPEARAAFGIWKAYIIAAMLVFFIARWAAAGNRGMLQSVAASSSVLLLFIALVSAAQWWRLLPINDPLWSQPETFRATSIFPYPNAVGLLAAPLTVLIAGVLAGSGFRLIFLAGFLSGIASIALAQSQGAMLAVVAGLLVIMVFPTLSHRMRSLAILGSVIVIIVFPILPIEQYLKPYAKNHPSALLRLEQWQETKRILQLNPFMGGGLANYQNAVAPYHAAERSGESFLYPHHLTLALWSEFGLLGLLAFWSIMAITIRTLLHSLERPNGAATALPILAALVAMLAHGFVDVPYLKNDLSALTWMIIALSTTHHE